MRRGDQGQIEFASGEFVEQAPRSLLGEMQFYGRVRRVEGVERLRDETDRQRGRRPQTNPPPSNPESSASSRRTDSASASMRRANGSRDSPAMVRVLPPRAR